MKRLEKPIQRVRDILQRCAETYRDVELRQKLFSIADNLEAAEILYDQYGTNATLFHIQEAKSIISDNGDIVTLKEMTDVYDDKFSKRGQVPRQIYDAIKALPKYGICPLCSHRVVSSLDHYLPKSEFPLYAITPLNLVPSCLDCNKIKHSEHAKNAISQTLHPYFDTVDDGVWLIAELIEGIPVGANFSAAPPDQWSQIKCERTKYHFDSFELANMYAANAAQELAHIAHGLNMMADEAGASTVKSHLTKQAESRCAVTRNSWQAALYVAMSDTQWFWNGGHRNILM